MWEWFLTGPAGYALSKVFVARVKAMERERAALLAGVCPDCGGRKLVDVYVRTMASALLERFRHRVIAECAACHSRYPLPDYVVRERVRASVSAQIDRNVDEILKEPE